MVYEFLFSVLVFLCAVSAFAYLQVRIVRAMSDASVFEQTGFLGMFTVFPAAFILFMVFLPSYSDRPGLVRDLNGYVQSNWQRYEQETEFSVQLWNRYSKKPMTEQDVQEVDMFLKAADELGLCYDDRGERGAKRFESIRTSTCGIGRRNFNKKMLTHDYINAPTTTL